MAPRSSPSDSAMGAMSGGSTSWGANSGVNACRINMQAESSNSTVIALQEFSGRPGQLAPGHAQ